MRTPTISRPDANLRAAACALNFHIAAAGSDRCAIEEVHTPIESVVSNSTLAYDADRTQAGGNFGARTHDKDAIILAATVLSHARSGHGNLARRPFANRATVVYPYAVLTVSDIAAAADERNVARGARDHRSIHVDAGEIAARGRGELIRAEGQITGGAGPVCAAVEYDIAGREHLEVDVAGVLDRRAHRDRVRHEIAADADRTGANAVEFGVGQA